ncbi:hypothetical protein L2E82_31762 [Cichorium intybus]|uniref:Uncharacterized protein n=1 Tax=Cichorium intybus TaxID=13427 RepID=A0ACB9BEJ2_CICIN|nr:hypothetical protein L2E82_31762 [Cichorium intybus]
MVVLSPRVSVVIANGGGCSKSGGVFGLPLFSSTQKRYGSSGEERDYSIGDRRLPVLVASSSGFITTASPTLDDVRISGLVKSAMKGFTEKIVNLMKSEKMFESQGGPIILSQVENEYGSVGKAYRRIEDEDVEENGYESDDPCAQKKPSVAWSIDLRRKFVAIVNQLGIKKAVPKRILDLMNVDGITRENVATYL